MSNLKLNLGSIDRVKNFVNIIQLFNGDFDLVSGRYTIDAKSIMGIFSLDLSKPVELAIYDESDFEKVSKALEDYIVK